MITVKVDGRELSAEIRELKTMGDVIEMVKATIDPDSIITSMSLQGNPLRDSDWRVPLSIHQHSLLEITTGDRTAFVKQRLEAAGSYVMQINTEFEQVSDCYLSALYDQANTQMAKAVDDLLAFINWYLTLLSMEPDKRNEELAEFDQHLQEIRSLCDQILQLQMFQSWKRLGEVLKLDLSPKLAALHDFCIRTAAH